MKKIFIVMCMVAGLISCTSEYFTHQEETAASVPMQFDIKVAGNTDTKATKESWAKGDKIYVFFNGLATKYLVLTYNGSTWSNASGGGTLQTSDFSKLSTKTLTAVHFPVAVDVAYADNQFFFTKGGKPVYNYYLFQSGKSYEVSGTTVSATLSMGKPDGMAQFHVAGIQSSVANYTFGCSKVKPVACKSVGTDGAIIEDVLQAGARLSGIADSDGAIFAGRLTKPGVSTDYTFTLATDSKIYTMNRTGKTLTAGKMYNFSSTYYWSSTDASSLYVDLGLSVLWANGNLGATSNTEYGSYFAWGELQSKKNNNFDWDHYYFGGSPTKYNENDNIYTLQPEDDAAYAALGGKFRMPTRTEWAELCNTDNCNWEWKTNYNGSGKNGFLVTSKKANYTSKSIFLPAAGKSSVTSSQGSYCYYWSSSLESSGSYRVTNAYATCAYYENNTIQAYPIRDERYYGLSIRPVRVK